MANKADKKQFFKFNFSIHHQLNTSINIYFHNSIQLLKEMGVDTSEYEKAG